jgi:hypothetical protein
MSTPIPVTESFSLRKLFVMAKLAAVMSGREFK